MGDERAEPFIDRLVVRNYGCVKDVSVALTPFHAFIGPNDSGKSTLLRAMHRVVHAVEKLDPGRRERMDGFNDLVSMKSDSVIEIRSQTAQLAIDYNASTQGHVLTASSGSHVPNLVVSGAGQSTSEGTYAFDFVDGSAVEAGYSVLIQTRSANRHSLITSLARLETMPDDQGLGVTSLLDYIRDKNEDSYRSIQNDIVDLFPNVARFQLDSRGKGKTFEVVLKDGATVQAGATSEGLRYYVAFAALRHALPRALMLVEEPENGLHPSRVADVVKVLRATSEHMQVIIATHSPLVINEMQPEEVTLVTRDPLQGTQTRPMTETAHFADRLRIYALGELWLSYADGKTEHGLVSDPVAAE